MSSNVECLIAETSWYYQDSIANSSCSNWMENNHENMCSMLANSTLFNLSLVWINLSQGFMHEEYCLKVVKRSQLVYNSSFLFFFDSNSSESFPNVVVVYIFPSLSMTFIYRINLYQNNFGEIKDQVSWQSHWRRTLLGNLVGRNFWVWVEITLKLQEKLTFFFFESVEIN